MLYLRKISHRAALALAIWLGIAALGPDLFAQGGERYTEPNFDKKLFARETILLAPQEIAATVASLTALASNFPGADEVDHRLRAKALAIALRLDGTAPHAIAANRALGKGEQPSAETEFNTIAEVASALWSLADFLETPEKNKDESVLQFCLVDIAREIDPSNLANSNRYPTRLPKTTFAGWGPIISGGSSEFVFPDNGQPDPKPEAGTEPAVEPPATPINPTRTAKGEYRAIGVDGKNPDLVSINGDLKAGGGIQPLAIIFSDVEGDTSQPLNEQRESMISALTELQGNWPNDGGVLVLSVSNGHGGDNALALPSTLLSDSLINERELDPNTTALGIVAPEGSIVPVDKLYQRLQSLPAASDIDTILIPAENLPDLQDIALLEDFETLFRYQLILVGSLKQAIALADAERDENNPAFGKSAAAFKAVQEVARDEGFNEMVGLSVVTKRFADIIAQNPEHASAKVLHDYGKGTLPKNLTRSGSLAALYRATGPVVAAMQSKGSAKRDIVLAAYEDVNRIQPILEPETRKLGETMSSLLKDIGTYSSATDKTSAQAEQLKSKIFSTWDTVRAEYTRLKNG